MAIKKTRAKTRKPVSRRPVELRHKRPLHRRTVEPTIREHWDIRKTLKQNLSSIKLSDFAPRLPETDHYEEKVVNKLSEPDAKIVKRLIAKYGQDDVKSMAKDIKRNKWQWTAAELKKKIAKYTAGLLAKPIGE